MAIVINPYLHEEIKQTRDELLERLSCVEAIRTTQEDASTGLSPYIVSLHEFNLYQYIKSAVDKGDFSGLDSYYQCKHFGIEISDKLLTWFKNNELDTIKRQVFCWLAALYWLDSDKRQIMEDQLYLPVLEEIRNIFSTYFEEEVSWDDVQEEVQTYSEEEGSEEEGSWDNRQEEVQEQARRIYHSACLDYYGSLPPEIINLPEPLNVESTIGKLWWVYDKFSIKVNRFYFLYRDWERIVIKQEKDNLLRSESSRDAWIKWKHQFASFDRNKSNIYSVFNEKALKGWVYLIKQTEEHLYKIGYTRNADIKKRLLQLQTGNPYSLEVVGSFPCTGKVTEKVLHSLFSDHRKMGEWYSLSPQDVKNILDQSWRISANIF